MACCGGDSGRTEPRVDDDLLEFLDERIEVPCHLADLIVARRRDALSQIAFTVSHLSKMSSHILDRTGEAGREPGTFCRMASLLGQPAG